MEKQSLIPDGDTPEAITTRTMRVAIGILGIALPFVLLFGAVALGGCSRVLDSISAYYHSIMRDVFVGILCAVSFFLFAYKGYRMSDFIALKLASVSALGVALFPTSVDEAFPCMIPPYPLPPAVGSLHFAFAALFFLTLAYLSWFEFTKTEAGKDIRDARPDKKKRNAVYRACALIMAACLAMLAAYNFSPAGSPLRVHGLAFWLESAALLAFGASWLVKGEFLLPASLRSPAKR